MNRSCRHRRALTCLCYVSELPSESIPINLRFVGMTLSHHFPHPSLKLSYFASPMYPLNSSDGSSILLETWTLEERQKELYKRSHDLTRHYFEYPLYHERHRKRRTPRHPEYLQKRLHAAIHIKSKQVASDYCGKSVSIWFTMRSNTRTRQYRTPAHALSSPRIPDRPHPTSESKPSGTKL